MRPVPAFSASVDAAIRMNRRFSGVSHCFLLTEVSLAPPAPTGILRRVDRRLPSPSASRRRSVRESPRIPTDRMFRAAFVPFSCNVPQCSQSQMLISSGSGARSCPHRQQIAVVGTAAAIVTTGHPAAAAFSRISRASPPHVASLMRDARVRLPHIARWFSGSVGRALVSRSCITSRG